VIPFVLFSSLVVVGQQSPIPTVQLRVVPSKEGYFLHEKPLANVEIANISAETLCFPDPDLECEVTSLGSLITTGEPEDKHETELFICDMCGGGDSGEALERAIRDKWISWLPIVCT
jgi:hypothetical protein